MPNKQNKSVGKWKYAYHYAHGIKPQKSEDYYHPMPKNENHHHPVDFISKVKNYKNIENFRK